MSQTIVRARFAGPTDSRGSRIIVRSNTLNKVIPVNYGWRTDSLNREAIAELFNINTEAVEYRMDAAGWQFYIVTI